MKKKRLFYDLETSQATARIWRTGKQFVGANQIIDPVKIISAHWKWEGDDKVHNIDWGLNKQCDKKIVKKVISLFNRADEIVAHNGDRFDVKWIRSRAMYHGLDMMPKYQSIDTYKEIKKIANLHSYSLKECCKYFGLPLKVDAGGRETWDKIQFDKDREALEHLLYYGDGDIVSLEALYKKIEPYIKPKFNYAVKGGSEKFACPECSSYNVHCNKTRTTAKGTIQREMRCKECSRYYTVSNKTYMDYLKFKIINNIK